MLELPADAQILERWVGSNGTGSFERAREALLHHTRVHPDEALRGVEHVAAAVRGSLSPRESGLLDLLRAHALRSIGRAREAAAGYEKVWRHLQQHGHRDELCRVAIGWIDALALMGQSEQAHEIARRGRRVIPASQPLMRARLEANLGNAWFASARWKEAARAYRDARRRFLAKKSRVDAAFVELNLANVYLEQGQGAKARPLCQSARRVFVRRKLKALELRASYTLAAIDLLQGDWSGGMADLERLEGEHQAVGDQRASAAACQEIAVLLNSVGAVQAALPRAHAAHEAYDTLGLQAEAARAAFLHGRLLDVQGHHHDAQVRMRAARRVWKQSGNRWAEQRARLELGRIHLQRRRTDEALTELRSVQSTLDENDRKGAGAECRALAAECHLLRGNGSLAVRLARKAYQDARSYPASLRRPFMAMTVAQGKQRAGDGPGAVRWARKSVDELEQLLLRFGTRFMDAGISGSREELYRSAVDIVLEHGGRRSTETALKLLATARSTNLIEDLLHRRESPQEEGLRTAIARLRDELLAGGESGNEDVRFRTLRGRMRRLESQLVSGMSKGRLRLSQKVLSGGPKEWRQLAGERHLVIYDRGRDGWRAFVLSPGEKPRACALPRADAALRNEWVSLRMLLEAVAHARPQIRDGFMDRTQQEATEALESMRAALWQPLGLESGEAVVVPSGPLHGIPLEAMVDRGGDSELSLSRIPHPSLLEAKRRRRRGRALLLHGGGDGERLEVGDVSRRLAGAGFDVRRGSRRHHLQNDLGPWSVLHVAAHGSFHRSSWLASGFQLSDGWVGYEHLDPRRLRGALLYLGSCESALVRDIPGAELDGWVAAGLGAGARELMLTLWKVDTHTAAAFASAFYESWLAGKPASQAAADARRDLMRSQPHPFSWAPFIAVG